MDAAAAAMAAATDVDVAAAVDVVACIVAIATAGVVILSARGDTAVGVPVGLGMGGAGRLGILGLLYAAVAAANADATLEVRRVMVPRVVSVGGSEDMMGMGLMYGKEINAGSLTRHETCVMRWMRHV